MGLRPLPSKTATPAQGTRPLRIPYCEDKNTPFRSPKNERALFLLRMDEVPIARKNGNTVFHNRSKKEYSDSPVSSMQRTRGNPFSKYKNFSAASDSLGKSSR